MLSYGMRARVQCFGNLPKSYFASPVSEQVNPRQQLLPEIPVGNKLASGCAPSALQPRRYVLGDTFNHVGAVGGDGDTNTAFANPVATLEGCNSSA